MGFNELDKTFHLMDLKEVVDVMSLIGFAMILNNSCCLPDHVLYVLRELYHGPGLPLFFRPDILQFVSCQRS